MLVSLANGEVGESLWWARKLQLQGLPLWRGAKRPPQMLVTIMLCFRKELYSTKTSMILQV